jgi:LysM repeat protein
VPLLGLVPVIVAVVLASEGRFGAPSASAPAATSTLEAGVAATAGATQAPSSQAQTPPSRTAATQAPPQTTAAQSNGTQSSPAQPAASTASQAAGPASSASGAATTPAARNPNSGAGLFRAYSVQPGDTVKFVAQMFGVSPASVAQASGLKNADQLRVGQVLTVPIQPGWLYRVQSGETLDLIAARTGIPSAVILSASKLATDSVGPGDVILIPDQSAARGK